MIRRWSRLNLPQSSLFFSPHKLNSLILVTSTIKIRRIAVHVSKTIRKSLSKLQFRSQSVANASVLASPLPSWFTKKKLFQSQFIWNSFTFSSPLFVNYTTLPNIPFISTVSISPYKLIFNKSIMFTPVILTNESTLFTGSQTDFTDLAKWRFEFLNELCELYVFKLLKFLYIMNLLLTINCLKKLNIFDSHFRNVY
jgi:hypothetical protein